MTAVPLLESCDPQAFLALIVFSVCCFVALVAFYATSASHLKTLDAQLVREREARERDQEAALKERTANQKELKDSQKELQNVTQKYAAANALLMEKKKQVHDIRHARKQVRVKNEMKELFKQADKDGDGQLSKDELKKFVASNEDFQELLTRYGVRSTRRGIKKTMVPKAHGPGMELKKEYIVNYEGNDPDVQILHDFFDAMDLDDSGGIDMVEFLQAIDFELVLCEIFNDIDVDGSGEVNAVELKDYLDRAEDSTFLHVLLDAGVDPFKVMEAIDKDQDKWLSLEEFVALALKVKTGNHPEEAKRIGSTSELRHRSTPAAKVASASSGMKQPGFSTSRDSARSPNKMGISAYQ